MDLDEEKEERLIECSKCNAQVEDILLLTCEHNLCLLCSSKNLQREENKENYSFKSVVCDKCGAVTILDPIAAEELCKE
jgi:ribosomal protein L40E